MRISSLHDVMNRFRSDERGTTMVEMAIVISLFLLILFAILDFGRLGYNWVITEKAMQKAARIAAVRPPVCAGLPTSHSRETGLSAETYPAGSLCSSSGGICTQVNRSCRLTEADSGSSDAQDAATEIWTTLQNIMPPNATRANIVLRYNYDRNLGFVGGPYVPVITAELVGTTAQCGSQIAPTPTPTNWIGYPLFCFEFITPLSALAATAGRDDTTGIPGRNGLIPFPNVSVTLPAEDMNQGTRG
jgi:hypothetical protein